QMRLLGLFLRGSDLVRRDAAQTSDEPQLRQGPDDPFRRVKLPRLHPVSVIVLELVVIIMVALAESEEGEEERVARGTFRRVGLAADRVTGAVDEERAVLQKHDAGNPAD